MVQNVEHIPSELEVSALRKMEVFIQRRIQIPKAGGMEIRQQRTRFCKDPGTRIRGSVIGPEALVAPEDGFKSGRVNPIRNPLCFRARAMKVRVADHVDSASVIGLQNLEVVAGPANGHGRALLRIEVAGQPPTPQN